MSACTTAFSCVVDRSTRRRCPPPRQRYTQISALLVLRSWFNHSLTKVRTAACTDIEVVLAAVHRLHVIAKAPITTADLASPTSGMSSFLPSALPEERSSGLQGAKPTPQLPTIVSQPPIPRRRRERFRLCDLPYQKPGVTIFRVDFLDPFCQVRRRPSTTAIRTIGAPPVPSMIVRP